MELQNTVILDLDTYQNLKRRSDAMDKLDMGHPAFVVMYRDHYFFSLKYDSSGDDIIALLKAGIESSEKEREYLLKKNGELAAELENLRKRKWWQFWT